MRSDPLFTKGTADVLDHATSEIGVGSKFGIDATKKLPGRRLQTPLAAAYQDGCSGEGEGGKAFQSIAADVRWL
jgi:3-polyprenyl-4-hydroxybenzoate decarboxylase